MKEVKYTARGFQVLELIDSNDRVFDLQQSSVMDKEDHMWIFTNIKDSDERCANCAIHLSTTKAKELIEHLQEFVDTGNIGETHDL